VRPPVKSSRRRHPRRSASDTVRATRGAAGTPLGVGRMAYVIYGDSPEA
jgi:hypothetical protein